MSVKQLVEQIDSLNIAEDLDNEVLTDIGNKVYRQFQEDYESMDEWLEGVEFGLDLMRQEHEGKSTPWDGASNYKDPLLHQASIQFGDRASLELLRSKDLIAAEIVGKDPEGTKKASAGRVTDFMNYQVNHDMGDWRGTQEDLLYYLPNYGACFKKLVYDPVEEVCESELVTYPDFVVNQATKNMKSCRSWSQILDMSKNDVDWRVEAGHWLEVEAYKHSQDDKPDGDKGSNEAEGVLNCVDNDSAFIEQHTTYDLDDDGYDEPYIITIHAQSKQVVRIVARYDEGSIFVRQKGVDSDRERVMPLPEAMQIQAQVNLLDAGGMERVQLLGIPPEAVEPTYDNYEVIKIAAFQNVVDYEFIKSPDCTFLGLGYAHLLGAMVSSVNTTTNQLHDAGTLNNIGGGLLSKEFRNEKGINRLKIGQWKQTQVPADKLSTGIFPNPTPEPSGVLYSLNESVRQVAGQFLAVADTSGAINAQTAPTTALAMIQEAMIPTSALFKRVLDAESREFKILFRIDSNTVDQEKYIQVLDDPEANVEFDFNLSGLDICPTANAEMSSKMQRLQIAEIEMSQFERVLQAGGNPLPILRGFFEAIGSPNIDAVFADAGEMTPEEEAQLQAMREAQETANQLQQLQVQILQREQDRLDGKTIAEIADMQHKRAIDEGKLVVDQEKVEVSKDKQDDDLMVQMEELRLKLLDLEGKYNKDLPDMPKFTYNPISGELTNG